MTKFEQVGINMQNEVGSIEEAVRKFANSCDICCRRGLHIECDHCAIREAHRMTVAAFNDYAEAEEIKRKQEEAEAKRKAEKRAKFERAMEKLTKELDLDEVTARIREINRYLDALEMARESADYNWNRRKEFRSDWFDYEEEYLDNWDRS